MEITIPENLNEITIKQYNEFTKQTKDVDNEEFVSRKMVEVFCNVKQDITKVSLSKFQDAIEILSKAFTEKQTFTPTFELDGVTYGFIPKLEDISLGEFIDLNKYLGDENAFAEAMSVMYRPVTEKSRKLYNIQEYEADQEAIDVMLNAPFGIFQGAMVFFYTLGNDLLKATLPSLEVAMETTLQQQDNSGLNGDGIKASMHLLTETLQSLMKLQDLEYTNV
tara:strand:+ start:1663 stop:2328 length:666 start_codon:yes stop_codon:yes gene_type:complete